MEYRNIITLTAISATLLLSGCSQVQLSILHGIDHFNHFLVKTGRAEQALPNTLISNGKTPAQVAKAEANAAYPKHLKSGNPEAWSGMWTRAGSGHDASGLGKRRQAKYLGMAVSNGQ